jgi:hypothetical protein
MEYVLAYFGVGILFSAAMRKWALKEPEPIANLIVGAVAWPIWLILFASLWAAETEL